MASSAGVPALGSAAGTPSDQFGVRQITARPVRVDRTTGLVLPRSAGPE